MSKKTKSILIVAISMISVFIMIAWGTLTNSYSHSWLAVFAGGILITIVSMVGRSDDDNGNNDA